jgi:hypothetical protein
VVLEVEGSNPSSRPRINNLRELSTNQTFALQNLDAVASNPQSINKFQNTQPHGLYLICALRDTDWGMSCDAVFTWTRCREINRMPFERNRSHGTRRSVDQFGELRFEALFTLRGHCELTR